jgi:hypothetical protein
MNEAIVANVGDLQDGQMQQVSVGDTDFMLLVLTVLITKHHLPKEF